MTVAEERAPVEFELSARYRAGAGPVLLTGVQAIARMLVEQHAADARAGLRTASFVSGYQGSPLGGLDQTLARATELQENAGLTLVPAVNEELAATAVWGSQVEVPGHGRSVDGVVGVWYGKAPGVDRAGDPLRHGNMCGAHPSGGVLVLAGDDPSCKSSTIPCISERTLWATACRCSTRAPPRRSSASAATAIALSRASGMWVGMKITADVADGVYALDGAQPTSHHGPGAGVGGHALALPAVPDARTAEDRSRPRRRCTGRAGRWSARSSPPTRSTRVEVDPPGAWLGHRGRRQGVHRRPAGPARPRPRRRRRSPRPGIRLLRLGMIHPLERGRGCASSPPASRGARRRGEDARSSRPRSATRSTACRTRPPCSATTDADGRAARARGRRARPRAR